VKAHPTADDQSFTVSCGIAVVRRRWVASRNLLQHGRHRSTPHSQLYRNVRKARTTTLSNCQIGFIRNLKLLSTNLSYYQSVATIDHFPQLSRLRLRCIERSFTASQFYWIVSVAPPYGKKVSVAIVTHATEKSATAHPVPSLCFPAYRTHTSMATRQE
jgi:hypothetical protein